MAVKTDRTLSQIQSNCESVLQRRTDYRYCIRAGPSLAVDQATGYFDHICVVPLLARSLEIHFSDLASFPLVGDQSLKCDFHADFRPAAVFGRSRRAYTYVLGNIDT